MGGARKQACPRLSWRGKPLRVRGCWSMRWSRNGDAELEAVRDAEVQADIRAVSVQSDYSPEIELGVGALLPGKRKSARFMSGSALGILIPKDGDISAQVKRRIERQAYSGRPAIRQVSTAPRSV